MWRKQARLGRLGCLCGSVFLSLICVAPAFADDPGYALRFDGTSDHVRLGSTSSILGAGWETTKSVSLWVKPTGAALCTAGDPGSCDAIFGDRPRLWGISRGTLNGEDRIWVWNYDGGHDRIGIPYAPGAWTHIALVHAGGTLSAYKDGVEAGTIASGATSFPAGTTLVLYFGGVISTSTKNWTFQGEIDEVRIWNRARSAAEIAADMNRLLTGSESGLAAYYRMSNGSGTSLNDDSIHSWTGSLLDGGSGVPADGQIAWVPSGAFGSTPNQPPVADPQAVATPEDTAVPITLTGSDPDGSPLTFRIAAQPAHGALTGTPPAVTYTPNPNYNGADSFTFVAGDGAADSAPAAVGITVQAVNDAPAANPDGAVTSQRSPVSIQALANDTDPDGDTLSITAVATAANGTAAGNGNSITYTPDAGFWGIDTFGYTIADGNGGSASAQVSVTVNRLNAAPAADPQSVSTSEDTSAAINLTGSDPDGDALSFRVVSQPAHGSLGGAAPSLTYTPAADYNGPDGFSFVANDGTVDSAPAAVSITVQPVNDNPSATADSATTVEGVAVAIPVLSNDGDPDGDALAISLVGNPARGSASQNGGVITYAPEAGFTGSDAFSYTVSDGNGGSASAQVTITVNPVLGAAGHALDFDGSNDYAMLAGTAAMMGPGWEGSKTVSLWIKPEGAGQTCSDVALCDAVFGDRPRWWGISRGVVGGADRLWIWNYDGSMDIIGVAYESGQWIHVSLVHGGGVLRAFKNGVQVGSLPSGNTMQPSTGALPVLHFGGIINAVTRNFTFAGQIDEVSIWNRARSAAEISLDHRGILTGAEQGLAAYYRMSNGSGAALTDDSGHGWNGTLFDGGQGVAPDGALPAWVPSTAPVTHLPEAFSQSVTTAEDTAASITLAGSDPEGFAISFSVTGPPSSGSLTGTAPNLVYTPGLNFNGGDSFRFRVNDGIADSAEAVVSLTVTPVNDPPVATDDLAATAAGTPVAIAVLANDSDPDGDTPAVTGLTPASRGTVVHNGTIATYTPDAGFSGSDAFGYTISDGNGRTASAQVTVTVNPLPPGNAQPTANSQSVTTAEDTAVSVTLSGSDPDGNPLVFRVVGAPVHGALSGTAPALTYSPAAHYNGADSFTFVVNDGLVDSAPAQVSLTVTPVNDPPVAAPDAASTNENVSVSIPVLANDSDPDGDSLTVVAAGVAAHGSATVNGAGITYTPEAGYFGADSFSYTISDGNGGSAAAQVNVTVVAVNSPPTAAGQAIATSEDTPKGITLSGSDPDGDPLTYRIVTQPAHGNVSGAAPVLTYTPGANYNGPDSFTFVANDGTVDSAPATVSVTVTPVNDLPSAADDTAFTPEGVAVTISVLANDSDADGDALTVSSAGSAANGTVANLGDSVRYTPDPGFGGADSFTYTVSDGNGGTAVAAVQVTVTRGITLEETGFLITPGDAWNVTVAGGVAYVADVGAGLRIVDVSNPANPVEIGAYDTTGRTYAVELAGSYAYLADGRDGMRIVDVSNPAAPVPVGRADTPDFAWGISVDLPYVYVADRWGGLRILDASDVANPVEIAFVDTPGQATDVVRYGEVLYVADFDGGLHIVDVSNPASPVDLGAMPAAGTPYGLILSDGYLYVAAGQAGLRVLDLSNPTAPVEVAFHDTPGLARCVRLMGGYAWVSDETDGMIVIDISNPLAPEWAATADTPGRARGVGVAPGFAYVADHEGGLRVIRVY